MRTKHLLFILITTSILLGCKKFEVEYPEIEITEFRNVTHSSAIIVFDVPTYGSFAKTGIMFTLCYSESGIPTVDDMNQRVRLKEAEPSTKIMLLATKLKPATQYNFRVHYQGSYYDKDLKRSFLDEFYSGVYTITTKDVEMLTDARDGKKYPVVNIGNQKWMAENLAFEAGAGSERHYFYNKDDRFGMLYNYETALNACPNGWRLPSDEDWMVLEKTLGVDDSLLNTLGSRGDSIGMVLKGLEFHVGSSSRLKANNATGFTALPDGNLQYSALPDGTLIPEYVPLGLGYFYTSTSDPENSKYAFIRQLEDDETGIARISTTKDNLLPVRCVKN